MDKDKEHEKWIRKGVKQKASKETLKLELRKAGYTPKKINELMEKYYTAAKSAENNRIWVILIIILLVIGAAGIYRYYNSTADRVDPVVQAYVAIDSSDKWNHPPLVSDPNKIAKVSDDTYVNSILTNVMAGVWKARNCTIPKEDALINLVKITRVGDSFEYSCDFGKYYSFIPFALMGKSGIYSATIENCNLSVIQAIDASLRSGGLCSGVGLDNPGMLKSLDFNEYYLFDVGCKLTKIDYSWIKYMEEYHICFGNLTDTHADSLIGKEMATDGFSGIIIPSLNMVVY